MPFRQPGQYEDVETGLYYNRFRYYNPESGIFISSDPISILGGLNTYAYV
ncbi:RHS repeat-associated core domain-containing protein, partial [Gilliamella sp. Lep-s21]|nr:Rhs family protein [Gilliamella sp. Lep-s35]MWP70135.1 Rhs family protein [Gilliamella sp. Lep-s5]MWP78362.1 Rhs family protein [Gilliamella sp. Lep-s21]